MDFLQDRPFDHRVIGKLEPRGPGSGVTPGFGEVYFFWIQNDFPYHDIQSLDFSRAPHMPDIDRDYLKAFELKGTDIRETDLVPAIPPVATDKYPLYSGVSQRRRFVE